jgi:hypothetical protein
MGAKLYTASVGWFLPQVIGDQNAFLNLMLLLLHCVDVVMLHWHSLVEPFVHNFSSVTK